jgi:DNA modification methylase
MPESVTDRPTTAHEYIFLLSKSRTYYYDADAIREPHAEVSLKRIQRPFKTSGTVEGRAVNGREDGDMSDFCHPLGANKRSVWNVATAPFKQAHFATFPPDLVKPCILAGCPEGGTVLDPFMGSGTTAQVARSLGRKSIGFELNADYIEIAAWHRLAQGVLL